MFDISVRYSFSISVSASGCRRSVVAVKSLMSEKKMVRRLRSVCDHHVALAAEDALVDLRREIARDLHRDAGEEFVGRLQLAVEGADDARPDWRCRMMKPMPADAPQRRNSISRYLKAKMLPAKGWVMITSWMPRTSPTFQSRLRAFRMGVVAGDASLAHHHRRHVAEAVSVKPTRVHVGQRPGWDRHARRSSDAGLEMVEVVRRAGWLNGRSERKR